MKLRAAVFASGRGSNFEVLADAVRYVTIILLVLLLLGQLAKVAL